MKARVALIHYTHTHTHTHTHIHTCMHAHQGHLFCLRCSTDTCRTDVENTSVKRIGKPVRPSFDPVPSYSDENLGGEGL